MQKTEYWKYLQILAARNQIRRIEKSLLLLKIRRIEKTLLLLKIRRIEKSLLLLKIRRIEKLKSPCLVEKLRLKKSRRNWKSRRPAYCLDIISIISWLLPSLADEHVQILVDVMNLACSLQVRRILRLPCLYGWPSPILYRLFVPARHAKKWLKSTRQPKSGFRLEFHWFLSNHKIPNSAYKRPITEPKKRM